MAILPKRGLELHAEVDCQGIARAFKLGAPELRGANLTESH